jgi:hypothetical protein
MIVISNSQRDQILRYLDMLCKELKGDDNRTYNTKRLARKLVKALREKKPVNNQNQQ